MVNRQSKARKLLRKIDKLRVDPNSEFSKLTAKQQGYVEDKILTGNNTEAAARNYDVKSRITAKALAANMNHAPKIRNALAEIYATAGADRQKAARVISQAMDAEIVAHTKEGVYQTKLVDHRSRLEGAKALIRILGDDLHTKKSENKHLHVHVNIEEANELEETMLDILQKKLGKKSNSEIVEVE